MSGLRHKGLAGSWVPVAANVSGKVFNVATGCTTTLVQAYEEIKRITGYDGVLNFAPEREGDIKHDAVVVKRDRHGDGFGGDLRGAGSRESQQHQSKRD